MGFKPYPGTLNVQINIEDYKKMGDIFSVKDFELIPEESWYCSASLKKVRVNGIPGAVVIPSDDVRVHGKEIIEVITSCHIKETLKLQDEDEVTITDY